MDIINARQRHVNSAKAGTDDAVNNVYENMNLCIYYIYIYADLAFHAPNVNRTHEFSFNFNRQIDR